MDNQEKYSFKQAQENYPLLFSKEKQKLRKLLGAKIWIEHIGSTAVSGLGGKGIIDIMVLVSEKNVADFMQKLLKKNYKYFMNDTIDRFFFEKDYKYKNKTRRVHVHLTYNKENFFGCLAFRNYLREHPEAIKKYEIIKKNATVVCEGDGQIYRNYKKKFIDKITGLAKKPKTEI